MPAKAKASVSPLRKWIMNLLKISVTGGILYYLYSRGMLDFSRVHGVLTDIPVVTVTFTIFILAQIAGVIRWRWLLQGQDLNLQFGEALQLTMIGVFFNTAIPGAVSGDVVKGYYVVSKQPDGRGRIKAFTTLLLDRLLGLSALVFVSFFAMVFNRESISSVPALKPLCGLITMLTLGVVAFFSFVLIPTPLSRIVQELLPRLPLGGLLAKFFDAVKSYEDCKGLMVKGFLISICIHLGIITAFMLLSRSLGGFTEVPAAKFFFLIPFGLLVTAIPIAPAGLGTGHYAFFKFFGFVGASGGADLFTLFVTFQIIMSLIGGLFYLRYRGHAPTIEQ